MSDVNQATFSCENIPQNAESRSLEEAESSSTGKVTTGIPGNDSIGSCQDIQVPCNIVNLKETSVNNLSTAPTEATQTTTDSAAELKQQFFRYKMMKQASLMGIYICIGLTSELPGPTLPDLKTRIGVNYEEISRSMVGKSIGILFGSIVGSYLHEILSRHSDLLNTFSLLMMSAAAFILPWSTSVATAAAVFFLHGLGHGSVQVGGNTMVMHLWREKATTAIMGLNFAFGLGALLSPWLASPFLSQADTDQVDEVTLPTFVTSSPVTESSTANNSTSEASRIEIPYTIAGVVLFIFSLAVLGLYIKGPPFGFPERKRSKIKEMASPASCSSGHSAFGTSLFICLFFYFLNGVGGEKAYGKFLFSYAFEENILTKKQAYFIQSTFWLSFTVGRLLGVPLSRCIPVHKIIIGDIIVIVLSTIFLVNLAGQYSLVLWVFTVIIGMSIARIYPTGMAWANLQLSMNTVGVLVLIIGAACGDFIYQYITGYMFETTGPHALMYIMLAYGICLTISASFMIGVSEVIPHESPYDVTMEMDLTQE